MMMTNRISINTKSKMNKQTKSLPLPQPQPNIDDEQIEKTLNFFDSILDPYLIDDDTIEKKSVHQIMSTKSIANQPTKHPSNGVPLNSSRVPVVAAASSSSSALPQHPASDQFRNFHSRYQPLPSAVLTNHVRRYTSENNLYRIPSPPKPVLAIQKTSAPVVTSEFTRKNVASVEDLTKAPMGKKFSQQKRLSSSAIDKTNGISASLIDLTAIDKGPSRPRFRFIPPSNNNLPLKKVPETEQRQRTKPKPDQFHVKVTPSSNQSRHSHQIFKPTVIIPPKPHSVPIARLTESNIYHHNNNSAFKPPRSSKNPSSPKIHQVPGAAAAAPIPVSNMKRSDALQKPNAHIGITNSNTQLSNSEFLLHRQRSVPQFHQSMLNLSSSGILDSRNVNMFGSRLMYPPSSSQFIRSPPYTPQSNKLNRHYQYPQPPPPVLPPPPPAYFDDSIIRRIQQANNSSHINGQGRSAYRQPFTNGVKHSSQQQNYPYNPYVSNGSGLSSPRTNSDYFRRQHPYLNPVKVHKHHSPQNPASVQSTYHSSLPMSNANHVYPVTPSNIYYFNSNTSSSAPEQSRRHPHHENYHVTTYL